MTSPDDRDLRQAGYFENRVAKRARHLSRWARREGLDCYRAYDRDIPEIPLALDVYGRSFVLQLFARPYEKDPAEEESWLGLMREAAARALGTVPEEGFTKLRTRQRGCAQYERVSSARAMRVVEERGLRFKVNLSDYLDTGLFLDHRETRAMVRRESGGKRALNLFCYTGSFTVNMAAGGAKETDSVDLSSTYLEWARENMSLNGFDDSGRWRFFREDVRQFLARAAAEGRSWDLVVVDPPTFSNSARSPSDFDVNRDWLDLLSSCVLVAAPGARIFFSTNSRGIKFDPSALEDRFAGSKVTDLSAASLSPDFRNRKVHRLWVIDL